MGAPAGGAAGSLRSFSGCRRNHEGGARASRIAHATGVQARGAVMFGDEMIDEASHKMARAIVARVARPASATTTLATTRASGREIRKRDRDV
jgi:hypothetical protein